MLFAFLTWEGVEQAWVREDRTAHGVHYARGLSTSVLTSGVVAWVAYRQHRRRSAVLEGEAAARAREAHEARQLLERIVDAMPVSLVVLDREQRIVRANRTAERVHGPHLVGSRCFDALAGRCDRCASCPAQSTFDTGGTAAMPAPVTDPRTGEVLAVETHPLRLEDGQDAVRPVPLDGGQLPTMADQQLRLPSFGRSTALLLLQLVDHPLIQA